MTAGEGRIDYVRLALPFEAAAKVQAQQDWEYIVQGVCRYHNLPYTCYDVQSFYERSTHHWIAYFNVWGEAANYFFFQLPVDQFHNIIRLDYREPLRSDKLDFKELFDLMEKRASSRSAIRRFVNPHRKRANGRDSGGGGITMGGENSRKRLTIYQRGKEGAAIEVQIASTDVKRLITDALSQDIPDGYTPHVLIYHAMRTAMDSQCVKYTGCDVTQLECGAAMAVSIEDYSQQESLLVQCEMLFNQLDIDGATAFVEAANLKLEERATEALQAQKLAEDLDDMHDAAALAMLDIPDNPIESLSSFLDDIEHKSVIDDDTTYNG